VHEMAKLYHLGVHTFYRPRNWGDGDDAPVWGPAPATSKADTPADKFEAVRLNPEVSSENPEPAIKSPEMAAKGSQALAAPERAATAKIAATAKL
jgi:hypothetical protein